MAGAVRLSGSSSTGWHSGVGRGRREAGVTYGRRAASDDIAPYGCAPVATGRLLSELHSLHDPA
jgi:hypothetical protein